MSEERKIQGNNKRESLPLLQYFARAQQNLWTTCLKPLILVIR